MTHRRVRLGFMIDVRTLKRFSGADRDRTGDPRLAKPVLSQLSYNP